jgi:hypothetical protein
MKMTAEEMITMMQSVEGRTPLQPMRLNPSTDVRLQLNAHGYDVAPLNSGKRPFKGWPKQPNEVADIRRWGGVAACGDGDGSSEPPGQSRATRSATPRAPPPVGAIDAACPQSDRRYRQ